MLKPHPWLLLSYTMLSNVTQSQSLTLVILLVVASCYLESVQSRETAAFLSTETSFLRSSMLVTARRHHAIDQSTTSLGMSIFDEINEKKDADKMADFNPLNYNRATAGSGAKSSTYASERQVISLRKTTMTELVSELLNTDASPQTMEPILKEYQEFLLEPLEDLEAVLEPDSIYRSDMTREQRYQAYREEMEERVEKSRSKQGKQVLMAMKDFVLSFE